MKNTLTAFSLAVLFLLTIPAIAQEQVPPASFLYNGVPVNFATFDYQLINNEQIFTAPDGNLQYKVLTEKATVGDHDFWNYRTSLANLSESEETKIVSEFYPFDFKFPLMEMGQTVSLNTLRGSLCSPEDFIPVAVELKPYETCSFSTPSGRSSNECMPFIELNLDETHGLFFAIGWTGSWKTRFANDGECVHVQIGIDNTNFKLLPGENVIQPSVTYAIRDNITRREFKTLFHRYMMEYRVPRDADGKIIPPILAVAAGGGNKTPEMMRQVLQYVIDNKMPFDTYWVDAGWYGAPHEDENYSNCGPNWARYVGDWRINTVTHPTGDLLPIANAVHKAGMKFLLWFEPERIEDNAPILEQYPEYRHRNLLDLGNPEALKWIQNTVYGIIEKHKIDVYREDFNLDPGPVWEQLDNENPDRVGMAEMKHVAGLYQFLDDMRNRFPNILQENCASGGRRIDIEMVSRAHSYCRSDYYIGPKPGDSAFLLGQIATLNTTPYLPFQGCEFNCVPVGDDYAAFSIISSGTVITPSDFDGGIIKREFSPDETAWFKKVFDVAHRMQEFYLGDFYQLTDEVSADNTLWCAWQCDRDDLNEGFAIAFRRADSTENEKILQLGNIDPDAHYEIECYNGESKTVKGTELADWKVNLEPRSFCLIFYKKK